MQNNVTSLEQAKNDLNERLQDAEKKIVELQSQISSYDNIDAAVEGTNKFEQSDISTEVR